MGEGRKKNPDDIYKTSLCRKIGRRELEGDEEWGGGGGRVCSSLSTDRKLNIFTTLGVEVGVGWGVSVPRRIIHGKYTG